MVHNELTAISGCLFRWERACVLEKLRAGVLQLAHEGHTKIT